jgi:hypothetical protein
MGTGTPPIIVFTLIPAYLTVLTVTSMAGMVVVNSALAYDTHVCNVFFRSLAQGERKGVR